MKQTMWKYRVQRTMSFHKTMYLSWRTVSIFLSYHEQNCLHHGEHSANKWWYRFGAGWLQKWLWTVSITCRCCHDMFDGMLFKDIIKMMEWMWMPSPSSIIAHYRLFLHVPLSACVYRVCVCALAFSLHVPWLLVLLMTMGRFPSFALVYLS